jgi:hypothetical protein
VPHRPRQWHGFRRAASRDAADLELRVVAPALCRAAHGLCLRLHQLRLGHGHFHGALAGLDIGKLRLGHAYLLGGLLPRGAFVVGFQHE